MRAGDPALTRRTCKTAALNSTWSQRRSHTSAARSPCRKASRIIIASRWPYRLALATRDHACVEAVRAEQRLCRAVAARGRDARRCSAVRRGDSSSPRPLQAVAPLDPIGYRTDSGGMRSAAMYTLLESAKMNRLDPEAYQRDVLARIARSIASANSCPGTESRPADAPTSIITYLRHHAVCTLRARANAATVVLQLCARGSRHRQLMRSGLAGRKIKAPWMRITNAGRFTLIN
jgi:IS66 C-terminal element